MNCCLNAIYLNIWRSKNHFLRSRCKTISKLQKMLSCPSWSYSPTATASFENKAFMKLRLKTTSTLLFEEHFPVVSKIPEWNSHNSGIRTCNGIKQITHWFNLVVKHFFPTTTVLAYDKTDICNQESYVTCTFIDYE